MKNSKNNTKTGEPIFPYPQNRKVTARLLLLENARKDMYWSDTIVHFRCWSCDADWIKEYTKE
jgi:hypothetical protein